MADPMDTSAFPRFLELPPEIRLMIWNECLPHRVYELDEDEFYKVREEPGLPHGLPLICGNRMTTEMNLRPPTISRVCRESQNIALRSRVTIFPYEEMPEETYWESEAMSFGLIDPYRYTVHLNFVHSDLMIDWEGKPVEYFISHAVNSAQGGSLMMSLINYHHLRLLESVPNLAIVMRKIIIHGTSEYGSKSGLFGLLGDAPVQLVDISDQKRLDEFFALADEAQQKGHVTEAATQDLRKRSSQELQEEFTSEMKKKLEKPEDRLPPMRGTIMFRLCTDMCNNSYEAEEGFRPSPGTDHIPRLISLRGRGRGRGVDGGGRARILANREEYAANLAKTRFRIRGRLRNKVIA